MIYSNVMSHDQIKHLGATPSRITNALTKCSDYLDIFSHLTWLAKYVQAGVDTRNHTNRHQIVGGLEECGRPPRRTLTPPVRPKNSTYGPCFSLPVPPPVLCIHVRRPTQLSYHFGRRSGLAGPSPLHPGAFPHWPMPSYLDLAADQVPSATVDVVHGRHHARQVFDQMS